MALRTRRHRAAEILLLALCCVLAVSAMASAATPEAIRACVERNLTRYTNPADAVAAQYADLETACIAALDGSGVLVEFTPSTGGGESVDASPQGVGPGGVDPRTAEGGTGAGASGPSGARSQPQEGAPSPATPSASALIRRATDTADVNAGGPLPSSLGGLPFWLMGMLAAVVALILAALSTQFRRRAR